MGFMKRVFGGGRTEPGPGWASPMSAEEAGALVDAVVTVLRQRGHDPKADDGRVWIVHPSEPEAPTQYGLTNLAQMCHQVDRGQWPAIVGEHFDNLFAAQQAQADLEARAGDLDAVRDILKVRLFPDASLGGPEPREPSSWRIAPGLTAALVFDLPTSVATASDAIVTAWNRPREELLEIALANVRAEPVERQLVGDPGPSAVTAEVGEHFFVTSHALLLDEKLPSEAAAGAVFAVPHRHVLLYAPVADASVITSINTLIPMAVSLFNEGPGSVSPGLYWWQRGGSITLLPSRFDGRETDFAPPDEFVQVLNAVSAPPA